MSAPTPAEAFARIRLLRSPNIGPVSYRQLLARFGSAEAAVEALPDLAGKGGRAYRVAPADAVRAEAAAVRAAGARYLFHDHADYPPLLRAAPDAPPILTVRGDAALSARPCVAIVGARNASAAAVRMARTLAGELGEAGFVVVSGLARGIDGAAHGAALAGGTIGVIASGIDRAYPPEHESLQEDIATQGLLVAEQPPGTEPLARHFPSRNRIIAGIAAGTVVVEAAPKSGSLITARLAAEYGREVMAVPGSPLDPRAQGCNLMIREGAVLIQSADDVIELLSAFDGCPRGTLRESAPEWQGADELADLPADVAGLLTLAPVAVDEIIRQSGEPAPAVQLALLELELQGRLVRHAGGRVSLAA
ncbi:DNA-processing protein DprA [Parablastomonas sp. CN1-191]|uniref:DNA-processing protein DprA n=1 Tax=Parablastomonas sp. CN1-191 TaxID=3400908 RepID=UPI003BF8D631